MSDEKPVLDVTDQAIAAARVCVFSWSERTATLDVRARGASRVPEIEGEWRLNDFLTILDGLSASTLKLALATSERAGRLDLSLGLVSGGEVRLVGAFSGAGEARGLIFGANHTVSSHPDLNVEAVYQPIIRLRDGAIAGFEALARWRGGDGSLKSAGQMSGGDKTHSGAGLAHAMLDQASEALADWSGEFPHLGLFIQVNLTGADLFRADVMEKVRTLAQSERYGRGAFKIELTEHMALRDFGAGVAAALALEAAGAGLVLDDFGSGHSSLAWLGSIPAQGIKLDPQITQMAGNPRMDTILSSIARLARSLGMTITAEGVEDFDRIQFLKGIGCDYVQGFAYARPMTKDKADRFLKSQRKLSDLTS